MSLQPTGPKLRTSPESKLKECSAVWRKKKSFKFLVKLFHQAMQKKHLKKKIDSNLWCISNVTTSNGGENQNHMMTNGRRLVNDIFVELHLCFSTQHLCSKFKHLFYSCSKNLIKYASCNEIIFRQSCAKYFEVLLKEKPEIGFVPLRGRKGFGDVVNTVRIRCFK